MLPERSSQEIILCGDSTRSTAIIMKNMFAQKMANTRAVEKLALMFMVNFKEGYHAENLLSFLIKNSKEGMKK